MLDESVVFDATYFDGKTSRPHAARVKAGPGGISVSLEGNTSKSDLQFQQSVVRLGSRLGNTTRAIQLSQGARLETEDNGAVDELALMWNHSELRPHLLESNVVVALVALLGVALISAAAFIWGVPLAAKRVAQAIPDDVAFQLGSGTMETLDKILFEPSELSPARKLELETGFRTMAAAYPRLPLQLVFRKAGMPNAFALPNGTVVLTDELVDLAKSEDEIYAVLAHEIGHVEHRHTARIALESSAVGLLAMMVIGDASQAAGILGALPAIYANAQFSQSHETEADTFALKYMQASGLPPQAFADILQRMTGEVDQGAEEALKYISSHPTTSERIARFRH